jgi:hypothetical protein
MSSLSVAAAARAELFALEALEPRRLLSAGDVGEPIQIDANGTTIAGSYEGESSVRLIFDAQAGEHYVFFHQYQDTVRMSVLSEDGDAVLAATAPNEYHQFVRRLDWVAPAGGQFVLELAQITEEHWLYSDYSVAARVAVDQVGDAADESVHIEDHADVNGFIDSVDDSDWYSFDVEAGHLYHVTDGYYNHFSVYGSDGVTEIDSEEEYDFVFRAAETGKYFLRAFTDARSPADDYRPRVDSMEEPGYTPQTAFDWDLSQTVYGYHHTGEWEVGFARAFLKIHAQAGYTYVFNSATSKEIDLRAEDGQTVLGYGSYSDVGHRLIWIAPSSGTFFVTVGYYHQFLVVDGGGAYAISARVIPPQDISEARAILPEQTVNGDLLQDGQIDLIKFEAKKNALYTFMMPYEHDLYCCMTNYGPPIQFLMQVLGEGDSPGNGADNAIGGEWGHFLGESVSWQAPSSGTHYLSVSSTNWAAAGEYQITMTETLDDFGNNDTHATPLPVGIGAQGRIDYENDADVFSVNAVAGHRYAVSLLPSDSPDQWVQVWMDWDVDGRWPDGLECSDVDLIQRCVLTASETRSYPVTVIGDEGRPNYTIEALDITAQFPAAGYQALASGQPVSLNFDGSGDIHFFKIDAEAGKTYQFATSATWRKLNFDFVDAAGATVQPRFGELPARGHRGERGELAYTFAESGTYYIAIASFDPSMVGQAQLYFDEESDAEAADAPTLPPPEPRPTPIANALIASAGGSLESEGQTGFFTFHAIAGRSYHFRTVLGSLDDSILGLFDPITQQVIAVNDDTEDQSLWDDDVQASSSQIEWTADRSGDFYLVVYGFDEESTGAYRLEVYSTSAALKEETLRMLSLATTKKNDIVSAVDDALFADDEDSAPGDSDVWDDSQDNWDDSSLLDSDAWDDEEDWTDI